MLAARSRWCACTRAWSNQSLEAHTSWSCKRHQHIHTNISFPDNLKTQDITAIASLLLLSTKCRPTITIVKFFDPVEPHPHFGKTENKGRFYKNEWVLVVVSETRVYMYNKSKVSSRHHQFMVVIPKSRILLDVNDCHTGSEP